MKDATTAKGTRQRITEPVLGVTVGNRVPKLRQIVLISFVTAAFAPVWFAALAFVQRVCANL